MPIFISFDPGKSKCGLVLVNSDKSIVIEGKVVKADAVIDLIRFWSERYVIQSVFLGNGTTSKDWEKKLIKSGVKMVQLVEERGTTLKARKRYWELRPPKYFFRFLPEGLRLPPEPLDAVAALVLIEDYLNRKLSWDIKQSFKISRE